MREELEQTILGACLLEWPAYGELAHILKENNFKEPKHRAIWQAMNHLWPNLPIDLLSVTNQMRKANQFYNLELPVYLTELTNRVNSAANLSYHAMILLELDIREKLISAVLSYDNSKGDIGQRLRRESALNEAENALKSNATDVLAAAEALPRFFEQLQIPELAQKITQINQAISQRAKQINLQEQLNRVNRIQAELTEQLKRIKA